MNHFFLETLIHTNMQRGHRAGLGPLCHADYLGEATREPFGKFSHVTKSESNILFFLYDKESHGFNETANLLGELEVYVVTVSHLAVEHVDGNMHAS